MTATLEFDQQFFRNQQTIASFLGFAPEPSVEVEVPTEVCEVCKREVAEVEIKRNLCCDRCAQFGEVK